MHISEMQQKIQKKSSVFDIIALEFIAESYAYCGRNTCHQQSMCEETDLTFQIRVKHTFSNSIYLEFIRKKHNSDALLLSLVFGTR